MSWNNDFMLSDELSPLWPTGAIADTGYGEDESFPAAFDDFWPDFLPNDPTAEPAYFSFENVSFDCPPQQQLPAQQLPAQQQYPVASPWQQCIQDQPLVMFPNHSSTSSYDSSFSTSDSELEMSHEDTNAQPKNGNGWSQPFPYLTQQPQPMVYQHIKTEEVEHVHHPEPFAAVVENNIQQNQQAAVDSDSTCMDVDDPVGFKLPASKTPIMEAMVVCAINNWGISVVKSSPTEVIFRVTDFNRYYRISRAICSKHRPTEDIGSRVKSLRRWFINFPKKKDRQENPSFLLSVKPNTCKKVHGLIDRNTKLLRKRQAF